MRFLYYDERLFWSTTAVIQPHQFSNVPMCACGIFRSDFCDLCANGKVRVRLDLYDTDTHERFQINHWPYNASDDR